uniref:hypothetical protein n=1 Tax=uncultured Deefgea sp. TaxID=1304914 RepID=UPI0026073BF9
GKTDRAKDRVFNQIFRIPFFNNSSSILMVEGKLDRLYFEALRAPEHGKNKLDFEGEIFDYDGWTTLKNPTLLRFLRSRCKQFFITYDLDIEKDLESILKQNSFKRSVDYISIGQDKAGFRNIEGLVPRKYIDAINLENSELTSAAMHGSKVEQESAKANLKKLYTDKFIKEAKISDGDYDEFYKLVKIINKSFSRAK